MALELLQPAPFREMVNQGNMDALSRPGPALLIVEAARSFTAATVVWMGRKRFMVPPSAAEFVAPGTRVILDEIPNAGRVLRPLGAENQPICRIPVTR